MPKQGYDAQEGLFVEVNISMSPPSEAAMDLPDIPLNLRSVWKNYLVVRNTEVTRRQSKKEVRNDFLYMQLLWVCALFLQIQCHVVCFRLKRQKPVAQLVVVVVGARESGWICSCAGWWPTTSLAVTGRAFTPTPTARRTPASQ